MACRARLVERDVAAWSAADRLPALDPFGHCAVSKH